MAPSPPGTGVPPSPVKERIATRLATENTHFLSLSLTAGRGSGLCSGIFLKGEVARTLGPGVAPPSPRWGPRRARPEPSRPGSAEAAEQELQGSASAAGDSCALSSRTLLDHHCSSLPYAQANPPHHRFPHPRPRIPVSAKRQTRTTSAPSPTLWKSPDSRNPQPALVTRLGSQIPKGSCSVWQNHVSDPSLIWAVLGSWESTRRERSGPLGATWSPVNTCSLPPWDSWTPRQAP